MPGDLDLAVRLRADASGLVGEVRVSRRELERLGREARHTGGGLAGSFLKAASEPETIDLLTSAIVGNHEAVRRFGVVITESTLKQELLEAGIEGGVEAAFRAVLLGAAARQDRIDRERLRSMRENRTRYSLDGPSLQEINLQRRIEARAASRSRAGARTRHDDAAAPLIDLAGGSLFGGGRPGFQDRAGGDPPLRGPDEERGAGRRPGDRGGASPRGAGATKPSPRSTPSPRATTPSQPGSKRSICNGTPETRRRKRAVRA